MKINVKLKSMLIVLMLAVPLPSFAFSLEELACGAKICLSGDGGKACKPFEDKYYSFEVRKHGKTMKWATKRLRKKFLDKCKEKDMPETRNENNDQKTGERNKQREMPQRN